MFYEMKISSYLLDENYKNFKTFWVSNSVCYVTIRNLSIPIPKFWKDQSLGKAVFSEQKTHFWRDFKRQHHSIRIAGFLMWTAWCMVGKKPIFIFGTWRDKNLDNGFRKVIVIKNVERLILLYSVWNKLNQDN